MSRSRFDDSRERRARKRFAFAFRDGRRAPWGSLSTARRPGAGGKPKAIIRTGCLEIGLFRAVAGPESVNNRSFRQNVAFGAARAFVGPIAQDIGLRYRKPLNLNIIFEAARPGGRALPDQGGLPKIACFLRNSPSKSAVGTCGNGASSLHLKPQSIMS